MKKVFLNILQNTSIVAFYVLCTVFQLFAKTICFFGDFFANYFAEETKRYIFARTFDKARWMYEVLTKVNFYK